MDKCKFSDCTNVVFSSGLCSVHYNRTLRTGSPEAGPRARAPLVERLWKHIDKRAPNECWPWTGGVGGHGYGIIGIGGRASGKEAAHRVMWRLFNGPIPKIGRGRHGGVIRHTCNNRLCCNPAHLVLGTQGDNVADMWKPGRHAKGNARLTPEQIAAIKSDPRSSRKLAPVYGVTDSHIRSVRSGRAWKTLKP